MSRLDLVADPALQISEMAIAFGKLGQQFLIELQRRCRIDRIDPVLLIDRGGAARGPSGLSAFPGNRRNARYRRHRTRRPRPRRAARSSSWSGRSARLPLMSMLDAAEDVHEAHAASQAFLADLDEFLVGALEPGRPHPAFLVPERAETVPQAGVAPHHPVFDRSRGWRAGRRVSRGMFSPVVTLPPLRSRLHHSMTWMAAQPRQWGERQCQGSQEKPRSSPAAPGASAGIIRWRWPRKARA